jgi:hypothetical protein
MKLNKNILLGIIAIILCILLAYYWFFMNKVKEGLATMTTVNLTSPETIPMKITSLVISGGGDYLHLSQILVKDRTGTVIQYSTTNTASATNKGYVSNSKGIYNGTSGLDKLYDSDPNTFFQSKSGNDILTISFFEPVDIGSVLIRNRVDCCWNRIAGYTLRLYSNDIAIISHPLNDSALQTGKVNVYYLVQASRDNFMNSNVITYNIIQPPNVTGAPGSTGPKGPTGLIGPTGPRGLNGTNGINGKDGKDGKDGINGIDGKDGKDGPIGPSGSIGPTGPKGDHGINGVNGINGINGVNGIAGSTGQGPSGISRANEYSFFGASSIQTVGENFTIMDSLSEPMSCLSSPASYI